MRRDREERALFRLGSTHLKGSTADLQQVGRHEEALGRQLKHDVLLRLDMLLPRGPHFRLELPLRLPLPTALRGRLELLLPLWRGVRLRAHVRPRDSPRLEPLLRAVPLQELVVFLHRLARLDLPAHQARVVRLAEAHVRALDVAPLARPGARHELDLLALAPCRVYHSAVGPKGHRPVLSLATPPAAALPPVHELVALGQIYVCHDDLADSVVLWVVEHLDGPVPVPSVPLAVWQIAPLGRPARARLSRFRIRGPAIDAAQVLVHVSPGPPLGTPLGVHRVAPSHILPFPLRCAPLCRRISWSLFPHPRKPFQENSRKIPAICKSRFGFRDMLSMPEVARGGGHVAEGRRSVG